eukprot:314566-Pyramimonas_sp.AAC.1
MGLCPHLPPAYEIVDVKGKRVDIKGNSADIKGNRDTNADPLEAEALTGPILRGPSHPER